MFLTRFRINTARTGARKLLSSPQALHAAVMASFPDAPAATGEGPRVLWRLDTTSRKDTLLYVVSPGRPDTTHLVEQAGWPTLPEAGGRTAPYEPFLARLTAGETWAFRLSANPVHSIRRTADEPTKRTAHVTVKHQTEWLLKRAEASGFEIPERAELPDALGNPSLPLIVHSRRDMSFRKTDSGSGKRVGVKLVQVTYDGRLRVTDPALLRKVLTTGIGKGKAYGCGLLTLAPLGGGAG